MNKKIISLGPYKLGDEVEYLALRQNLDHSRWKKGRVLEKKRSGMGTLYKVTTDKKVLGYRWIQEVAIRRISSVVEEQNFKQSDFDVLNVKKLWVSSLDRTNDTEKAPRNLFFAGIHESNPTKHPIGSYISKVLEELKATYTESVNLILLKSCTYPRDIGFVVGDTLYVPSNKILLERNLGQLTWSIRDIRERNIKVVELDCYFEGGNIFVDQENKIIFHGGVFSDRSQGARYRLADNESFLTTLNEKFEGYKCIQLDVSINSRNIAFYYHLDTHIHLFPNGTMMTLDGVLDDASSQILREVYGENFISIKRSSNTDVMNILSIQGSDKFFCNHVHEDLKFEIELAAIQHELGIPIFSSTTMIPRGGGPHCLSLELPKES